MTTNVPNEDLPNEDRSNTKVPDKNVPIYEDDVAPGAEEIGADELHGGDDALERDIHRDRETHRDHNLDHERDHDLSLDEDVTAPGADRIGATDAPHNQTVYEDDDKPAAMGDAAAPGAENVGGTTKDNPGTSGHRPDSATEDREIHGEYGEPRHRDV